MSRRTTIYWTADQHELLNEKAKELGLDGPHELLTLLGLKLAGVEFKQTPKGRRKAILEQKEKTVKEYEGSSSGTVIRVQKILSEAGSPMTVDQIRDALGWAAPFKLHSIMKQNFVSKGVEKRKGPGRKATLWGLK